MSFVTIKVRRGNTTQWNSTTKNLANGEIGFNTTLNKFKIGTGLTAWADLPYLNTLPSEFNELVQDAVDSALIAGTGISKSYNDIENTLTISIDSTIANKNYVDAAVTALGSTAADTYIPTSLLGNADGVATLDENGKVPDSEISTEITRNTLAQTLINKTIGLGTGITSIYAVDNIQGLAGQNNISIYQAGLDKGGRINISSLGVISIANSGIGYVSGLVTNAGGTRFNITVGGNTLNGTLAEFNAALTDGDFATESYVATAVSNLVDSAPATLNTLKELSDALGADPNFATTTATALGTKITASSSNILTNKTLNLGSNTVAGTKDQFNAAMTDADFVTISGTETLTNKTLTSPAITSPTGIVKADVGLGNVDNTSDNTKALLSYISETNSTRTINSSTDKNKMIECSTATTITIPNDTQDSGWPIGSMVEIRQIGTGQVTIIKDAAVTMVGADSQFKTRVQWSTIMLEKRSANSWLITGDTTA